MAVEVLVVAEVPVAVPGKVLDKAPDAEPGNAGAPPLSVSAPTAKRFYPTSEGYPARTRGVLSVGRP